MIAIEEKVMDSFNENLWPFTKSLAGVALLGLFFGWFTELDSTSFKGASVIFAMVMYVPYIMYKYMRAQADDKKFDVEVATDLRAKALDQARKSLEQRDHVANLALDWKRKANDIKQKADAAFKECERLRASEQTLLKKIQVLNSNLADADKGLASADAIIAKAKANEQKAVASAVANATKPLAPYVELAKLYALDRSLMGIINNKSLSSDEHNKARGDRANISERIKQLVAIVQEKENENE